MKVFHEWVCNLIYGGIKRQEYQAMKNEILEKNLDTLSSTSKYLSMIFMILFVLSFFSEAMGPNKVAYGAITIGFMVIWLLCQRMRKKGKGFIILLWYAALTMICAYAIALNTFIRKDTSATTFCIVMIVAPLLFIDYPGRMFGYFVLVIGGFVILGVRCKKYYLAYADTVNSICCLFVGGFIHLRMVKAKLQEIRQRHHIERERDTDKLTGCMTKAAFSRLVTELVDCKEQKGTLIVIDVDWFKEVNDNYGHLYGDMVLHMMGEWLKKTFSDTAIFGRFGGDEFQVWLPEKTERKEIGVYLDAFLEGVNSIETPDKQVKIGVSVGIAVCPRNGKRYKELFENADAALYSAKNFGKNRYIFCRELNMGSSIVGGDAV
ncbi:GGDEF domain-containing protein [Roseburia sp. 499]|uniref:GGDEF domain-containing protein n=1 Tax=Roseburia sp. 499 TaxID=1261634 RepID=UPI000951E0EB|nr:GGDEF domain-containing protein [Roseburia sp. 499]WVK69998.1 GGDEF domain-containing protein [Roseburia sp. 499]